MKLPEIIQGGMGVAVSNWVLAKAVSMIGQLGVVSGTAVEIVLIRRLQDGDPGGHMRRALSHFPFPEIAERILDKYFIEGGKPEDQPYKLVPMLKIVPTPHYEEILTLGSFCEVWLAKEGHDGAIGINLLEKIQMTNVVCLYGALLASVDYVLMGAGIPREIPGTLDKLSQHQEASIKVPVQGADKEDNYRTVFKPQNLMTRDLPPLKRPDFLAIVSSVVLAKSLKMKSNGKVNGFIIEGPTAGGHNAPPRGQVQLNEVGEPIYGIKDQVDLAKIHDLGLPFWIAGSAASPEKLRAMQAQNATGIQVGTFFAFCDESGFVTNLKEEVCRRSLEDKNSVFTDPRASSTGFPFKVVEIEETLSEEEDYGERDRICDLGYLRHAYKKENGNLGYRCAAEPIDNYLNKGGAKEETVGRKCLCNGLFANIGHPQFRKKTGYKEQLLVTAGDDINRVKRFVTADKLHYTAADVIEYLLSLPPIESQSIPAEATPTESID